MRCASPSRVVGVSGAPVSASTTSTLPTIRPIRRHRAASVSSSDRRRVNPVSGPRRSRRTSETSYNWTRIPDADPSHCEVGAHGAKTRALSSQAGGSWMPSANRWPAKVPAASTSNVSGDIFPCSISAPCVTWARSSHRALRSSGNGCSERWRFHPIWNQRLWTSWIGSTGASSKPILACSRSHGRCPVPRGSPRAIGTVASICGWYR